MVQCGALPYQNVTQYHMRTVCCWTGRKTRGCFPLGAEWTINGRYMLVWSYFRFESAAGLAYFHGLCGHGSHQGLRQPAQIRADSDRGSSKTGDSFTGLELELLKNVPVFSQWNICVNIKLYVHISSLSRTFLT